MKLMRCVKLSLIICGMVSVLCGCGLFKTKINLKDYISCSYEGIDGYTSIDVSLDTEGIRNDFGGKISEKKTEDFNRLIDSMQVSASQADNLHNGDVIIVHVSYLEEYCENAGIKFAGNDMEVTIEGLEEGILLDLFADIVVNVKGTAPLAEASIENRSSDTYIQGLTFTLDKTTGFRAGETLTVSCNADKQEAKELGYVFLQTSRSYRTDGLDAYAEKPEDIDMDVLSEVVLEAENTVIHETEGSQMRMLYKVTGSSNFLFQYNKEWIDSIDLYEIKLFTASDMMQSKEQGLPYNKLFVIFKAYVTNADHGSDGYFCFEYSNLIQKADGSLSVKHDNQNLRYLCDDDYNELMEKVMASQTGEYTEAAVDISGIISLMDEKRDVSVQENPNGENN